MDAATPAKRAVLAAGTSWGSGAGDSGPRGRVPHKDTLSGIRGRRGRGRCARALRGSPPPGSRSRRRTRGGGWGWGGRLAGRRRGRRGAPGKTRGRRRAARLRSRAAGRPFYLRGRPKAPAALHVPDPRWSLLPPQPPSPLGDGEGGCPLPDAPAGQPARSPGGVQRGREGRAGWCGEGAGPRPRLPRGAGASGVRGLRGGAAGAGAQAAAGPWRRRDRGRGARRGEDGERAGSRYLYWAAAAAAAAPLWVNPK